MENSQIEEPERFEQGDIPGPNDECMAGTCDCDLCEICERSQCWCICDEMPQEIPFPNVVDDMRDEYDEAAGI